MERSNGAGFGRVSSSSSTETSDGEGSVEVLPYLSDYAIRVNSPGVDPGDFAILIAAFDDDCRSEGVNRKRHEFKGVGDFFISSGEQSHHKLMRRRAMKPPLEIRS